jgi:hypothetical protein
MGDRARFLKDLTARAEGKLVNRDTPAVMIGINHQTTSLDPRNRGHITPGGTGFKFHSAVRISLWRKEVFPKPGDTDESRVMKGQVAEGTVEKLRFGGPGRKFSVYIVPGRGVHLGMSAMFDCIHYKIGTRTDQGMIRLGTETFGRIGKLVDAAFEENDKVFDPFIEALGAWEIEHMEETINGEGSDGSEEEGSGSSDEVAEELDV